MTETAIENVCCGHIGEKETIFCLKDKSSCSSFMNGGKHKQFQFEPKPDSYYICKTTSGESAWCNISISDFQITNKTLFKQDLDSRKTWIEWKHLFAATKEATSSMDKQDLKQVVQFMDIPPTVRNLKTPKKYKQWENDEDMRDQKVLLSNQEIDKQMALLQLSGQYLLDPQKAGVPDGLINVIMGITSVLNNVLFQVRKIQGDLLQKAMLQDVSIDLTGLTSAVAGLKSAIGTNSIQDFPDLWSALEALEEQFSQDFQKMKLSEDKIKNLVKQLSKYEQTLNICGQRWTALGEHWIPLVRDHSKSILELKNSPSNNVSSVEIFLNPSAPTEDSSTIKVLQRIGNLGHEVTRVSDKLIEFEASLELLTANQDQNSQQSSNANNFSGTSNIKNASGVAFKDHYFSDEDSVKTWMQNHMTQPSHGLFVDIVSFSEFFGGDRYVERNTTLNDLYMSNKIGYATMADSIVAASFQNVLPGAYGHNPTASSTTTSSSDLQAQPELPGLKSFQKWDKQDGSTGRKYWIKKEARSTHTQIDGMIRQQLDHEAQYFARDLLMDSASMSEEMFNFISTSYEDTMHSGRFDSDQAWALTSKFVKRIFTEIGDARVIARDGVHVNDPWTTGAKFLFATLKAHVVMHDFMRLDIKDHPSISSEMVKFICYSQPSHDTADVLARLSTAETLM